MMACERERERGEGVRERERVVARFIRLCLRNFCVGTKLSTLYISTTGRVQVEEDKCSFEM